MQDQSITNQELIKENELLKQKIHDLEHPELERKLAQEALRESKAKLQAIFDTVGTGIIIIDKDTQVIIEANQTAIKMTGLSKERIIGQICHSLVCPTQAGKCPVKDLGQIVDHSERKLLCADGNLKDILKNVYPININGRVFYIESFIDISDRKQADRNLKENLSFLQTLIDTIPNPLFYKDVKGEYLDVNRAFEDFYGINRENIIGKTVYDMGPKHIADKCHEKDQELFQSRGKQTYEWKVVNASGDTRDVIFNKASYMDHQGMIIGLIGIISDITERKKAEEALQESEERYRTFVENASDIVFRTDDSGHFTFINPAGLRITGYEKEELIGTHYPALINPDMCEETMKFFARQFVNRIQNTYLEYPIIAKDKHEIWLGQNTQLIVGDARVQGFQAVARDITDRKRAEDARYKYEKLQGVLEMAGAICHEMNQPMQVIFGYSEMLLKNISENDPIHTKLDTIYKQIIRMGTITRKLMKIKNYETQDYAGISRIININNSSGEDVE